jgi:peroxiredoxin
MRTHLTTTILSLALAATAFAGATPGLPAPDFTLTDTEGVEHTLSVYLEDGRTVVLEWFNADCPFIKKHHANHKTMNETFATADSNVVWLSICSSAEGKQGHGLERNQKARKEYEMDYPVLLDADGAVGKLYGAKTTPHMFVITPDGVLAYNGAIDDDRTPGKLGKTNYVAEALKALAAGETVPNASNRPYGCSVKYGN